MNNNFKIVLLLITIILLRLVYYFYYYLLAKRYYKKYDQYVKNDQDNWYIRENRQNIAELFKKAEIKDSQIPYADAIGLGMVNSGHFSVFENLYLLRGDVMNIINGYFKESINVFRKKIINTFNPIYWIDFVIYLPKKVLKYLNIGSEKEGIIGVIGPGRFAYGRIIPMVNYFSRLIKEISGV